MTWAKRPPKVTHYPNSPSRKRECFKWKKVLWAPQFSDIYIPASAVKQNTVLFCCFFPGIGLSVPNPSRLFSLLSAFPRQSNKSAKAETQYVYCTLHTLQYHVWVLSVYPISYPGYIPQSALSSALESDIGAKTIFHTHPSYTTLFSSDPFSNITYRAKTKHWYPQQYILRAILIRNRTLLYAHHYPICNRRLYITSHSAIKRKNLLLGI